MHDANGDGKIDESEFQDMMSAVLKKTMLFTGAELGHELNEMQLCALIEYPFASVAELNENVTLKHVIKGSEEESKTKAKKQKSERKEIERKKKLEIKLHEMTEGLDQRKKIIVLKKLAVSAGRALCKDGSIVVEDPHWDPDLKVDQPEQEDVDMSMKYLEMVAIERVGFIFLTYKVGFWWWEILEMMRKYVLRACDCVVGWLLFLTSCFVQADNDILGRSFPLSRRTGPTWIR
jgi:hypothetical protein